MITTSGVLTMKKTALSVLLPFALALNACTSNIGANQYATSGVGQVNQALPCTVLSVRQVVVQSDNNAGMMVGGAAGGVAGTLLGGNDTTRILGGIGGAVLGGLAGDVAQDQLSKQGGYEYVVKTSNGNVMTVTQGNDVLMTPGEKCYVLYGNKSRVIPAN